MADVKENVIEWITGNDTVAVTLSQPKYINKVKKLAEKHGDKVQILAVNDDGSIFAHLPLSSLKLTIKPTSNMSEERKEKLREQLARARKNKED